MRVYFSGGRGLKMTPEFRIKEKKPHLMLTFWSIAEKEPGTIQRMKAYLARKRNACKSKRKT